MSGLICVYCYDLMEHGLIRIGTEGYPIQASMILNGQSVCGKIEHVNAARYAPDEPNRMDESIQRETRRVRAKQLHERSLREERAR